ncbi:MAG: SPOR domain-containing protein [Alcanivorax sediminis]|uniref:SPOR domain-containing protein n=1 Tax=Alcanivorax sediminis TaxID=2663008 RepID=UPI003C46C7B1
MEFDEDRFFSGASRGDYLEALTAHAGLGSVVVVDGDSGSGVSTLLGQAVMALLDDLEVVRIDGHDPHDGNVVVEALLRHFNIERPELPETLRRTLVDGRIVVVADNSEALSEDALATMASLKQKLGGRLGYFFGGQSACLDQVKAAGFVVDDRLSLPALTAEDIQDCAWFVLGLELDDGESASLCDRCEGNLGQVLASLAPESPLASSVSTDEDEASLSFGARHQDEESEADLEDDSGWEDEGEESSDDRAEPPWRHITAVAGLLVVVALLWFGLSSNSQEDPSTRVIALPVPAEPAANELPIDATGSDEVQPMTPTMEPVARLEDLKVREDGEVILEPVSDPVMQSDPPQKDTVMTLSQAPEDPKPAEAPEPAVAEPSPQPKPLVDAEGYRHAGWLATQDDADWFLQITATSQQEGARRVLDQIDRKGAYYEAQRNGKTVWLVLAGDYSSRQAALDAKSSLPAKLREAGPFPRKMADIRGEL